MNEYKFTFMNEPDEERFFRSWAEILAKRDGMEVVEIEDWNDD